MLMQDNVERRGYWYKCLLFSFILVLIIALWGCSPYKHWQAVNKDQNIDTKKRDLIAPVCAREFPLAISKSDTFFIQGKPVIVTDTSGYSFLRYKIDSLNKVAAKDPNCPQINIDSAMAAIISHIKPKEIIKHDTLLIKNTARDSALVYALMNTLKQKEVDLNDLTNEKNEWKAKAQKRGWIISLALAAIAGFTYFRFKTFFITKFASIGKLFAYFFNLRK